MFPGLYRKVLYGEEITCGRKLKKQEVKKWVKMIQRVNEGIRTVAYVLVLMMLVGMFIIYVSTNCPEQKLNALVGNNTMYFYDTNVEHIYVYLYKTNYTYDKIMTDQTDSLSVTGYYKIEYSGLTCYYGCIKRCTTERKTI